MPALPPAPIPPPTAPFWVSLDCWGLCCLHSIPRWAGTALGAHALHASPCGRTVLLPPSLSLCFHPSLLIVFLSPSQSPHLCVSLPNLLLCFRVPYFSVHLSLIAQSLSYPTLCDPRPHGLQHARLLCPPVSWSLLKFMFIELVVLSNHLILCHPLLLHAIFPSIRVFSDESVLALKWPKYWSFSFSPSNEYARLTSFRIDHLSLSLP